MSEDTPSNPRMNEEELCITNDVYHKYHKKITTFSPAIFLEDQNLSSRILNLYSRIPQFSMWKDTALILPLQTKRYIKMRKLEYLLLHVSPQ